MQSNWDFLVVAHSSGKPYTENSLDETARIRTFADVDEAELIWHRDRENRKVTVLEGKEWFLQIDDCLPVPLNVNEVHEIPKMVFHRLIKGKDSLRIRIEEWQE
jgi:hypothetical protein